MDLSLQTGTRDLNRNDSRTRRRAELAADPTKRPIPHFIAVDGEGVPNDAGGQDYILLGVGTNQIEDEHGLSFGSIMAFLYSEFRKNPNAVYVGFYLGYDFAHWLKGIPENRARTLLLPEGIASRSRKASGENHVPFPVRYGGWEFDLLPGNRRWKLRPECCTESWNCRHKKPSWMYICDAGPFFQTSLLKAVNPAKWKDDPIVSPGEYDTLVAGKESRGNARLDDDMARYNALENVVLGRLMERQALGLNLMGVRLNKDQWFGPGQVSAAWLATQGIPRRKIIQSLPYQRFQEIARRSYFGGWFEIFMHGQVHGESYGYDINSAYPHIMSTLPCLQHGRYRHGRGQPPNFDPKQIYLLKCTAVGDDSYIGSAPFRSTASRICRPHATTGYYWLSELEAGMRAGVCQIHDITQWWSYEPCDCPPPLATLSNLYQLRQEVGKDTSLGKAAKLVYNSAYGKFAQSVGDAPYGNWIYASLTTSGCRSIILDAISTHPYRTTDVEMIATDGIFFRTPHPTLPISERLGEWSASVKEELVLFKPGFYWDKESAERITFRSRGIRPADFAGEIPKIERHFQEIETSAYLKLGVGVPLPLAQWPEITFKSGFAITSPLLALRRGHWDQAGQITTDKELTHTSSPRDKRYPYPILEEQDHWEWPVLRTFPYKNLGESEPYTKAYADADPWSQEAKESLGLTPDGTVISEFDELKEEMNGNG